MSYTLERFGSIYLPLYNRRTDATPVQPRQALLSTAAGTFDAYGSDRAPQKLPHAITLVCVLAEDTEAALRTSIDALRAAVGTRATLYRRADDDGTVQRCTARLVDMDYQRGRGNLRHQELKLAFQQLDPWVGKRWEDWTLDDGINLDDGYYFDSGAVALTPPASPTITVGGNITAVDAILSVTMAGTDTDPVYVVCPTTGVALVVDGPWALNDLLVIDNDARTITLNGADAYSRLDLDSGYGAYDHTANQWIELPPGTYEIFVLGTAIDDAELTLGEAWA